MKTTAWSFLFLMGWVVRGFSQNIIVLDNGEAAFEGVWSNAFSAPDRYGTNYFYAFAVMDNGTSKGTYRPNITVPGKYHVEISYPQGQNRTTNASWTISCKSGTFTAKVNQRTDGGVWVRIGSALEFAAGTNGFVQLINNAPDAGEIATGKIVVIADAVRFVPANSAITPGTPSVVTATAKPQEQTFVLNISIDGQGAVGRSPDQSRYPAGSVVTLTAKPAQGFVFGGWTRDVNRMLNPFQITMNSDKSIVANFWEAGIGIIMDETDALLEGKWLPPQGAFGGARNGSYAVSQSVAGKPTFSATYRPQIPRTGFYDVWVWYLAGENRATGAPWEIACKSGKETISVNQTKNGGDWFLLAAGREFEQGTNGYVRLSNNAQPIPSVVIADGVAFVYVGAP